jgi:hypothetical protein
VLTRLPFCKLLTKYDCHEITAAMFPVLRA